MIRNLSVLGAALASAATGLAHHTTRMDEIHAAVGVPNAAEFLLRRAADQHTNKSRHAAGAASSQPQLTVTKFGARGAAEQGYGWLPEHFDPLEALLNSVATGGEHADADTAILHLKDASNATRTPHEWAHPHTDSAERVAVAFKGEPGNLRRLRAELEEAGVVFRTLADAETVAQLVGFLLDSGACATAADAVRAALARLEGAWAAVAICADSRELVAGQHGSQLCVGVSDGRAFVTSDPGLFAPEDTRMFVRLADREVAVVTADASEMDLSRLAAEAPPQQRCSPAPFAHWVLAEIYQQPEAVGQALGFGARLCGSRVVLGGLDAAAPALAGVRQLALTGTGSSLWAAQYIARLARELHAVDMVAAMDHADYLRAPPAPLVCVSESGESGHAAVAAAQAAGQPALSVVNAVGSLVARTSQLGVYCNAGRERAEIPTKTFASQVVAGALVAAWFAQRHRPAADLEPLLDSLNRLPIVFGSTLRSHDAVKRVAQQAQATTHWLVLGAGYAEPVGRKAAAVLRELGRVHATFEPLHAREAVTSLGFAGADTAAVVFSLAGHGEAAADETIAELRRRGALVVVVTDRRELAGDGVIRVPPNGAMTALAGIVPVELLAYELAVRAGQDPDKSPCA